MPNEREYYMLAPGGAALEISSYLSTLLSSDRKPLTLGQNFDTEWKNLRLRHPRFEMKIDILGLALKYLNIYEQKYSIPNRRPVLSFDHTGIEDISAIRLLTAILYWRTRDPGLNRMEEKEKILEELGICNTDFERVIEAVLIDKLSLVHTDHKQGGR